MKNADNIKAILAESRNGAHGFFKVGFYPMAVSDGAKDLAEEAGCYWLFDILGTEVAPRLIKDINAGLQTSVLVDLEVDEEGRAKIRVTDTDDGPAYFEKGIQWTDFPPGEWKLFEIGTLTLTDDGQVQQLACCLISEH